MKEKKLEVKNLRISFKTPDGKVQAVRNISFDLYKGETLAIVGESGSGKSVTNRSIIGISAGNAIIESGEILYDGQDLLKISEEDFHKIRGDKIAMIFQDPMSSLNPIMKIGKQLTEAMILKGRTSQKNGKKDFKKMLNLLSSAMNGASESEEEKKQNNKMCKDFNAFAIEAIKLEDTYNQNWRIALDMLDTLNKNSFLIEKDQEVSIANFNKNFLKEIKVLDLKLFTKDIELYNEFLNDFIDFKNNTLELNSDNKDAILAKLDDIKQTINKAISYTRPDYFSVGYQLHAHPKERDLFDLKIEEINKIISEEYNNDFLNGFKKSLDKALQKEHMEIIEKKKESIEVLDEAIDFFSNPNFDKKEANNLAKVLFKKCKCNIEYINTHKVSSEYSFASSLKAALNKHFDALKNNPKELKRYEKQSAKYNALKEKGKEPSWKVVPAATYDLSLSSQTIVSIIDNLRKTYVAQIEENARFDSNVMVEENINYLKEKASQFVYKVSKRVAKRKAIKLLEEVGIAEPEKRYKQYPFEFSGGMRQRIVIAIALAANPDILICDEPTTALDVTIQSQILELINKLKAERNLSIIFITHDLGVVANMADRIAVMYAGKIVEYGTANDVFYDPRHPYTWALLSSMPDLDTKEKLEAIPGTPPNMIFPPKGDAFAERNVNALKIDFEEEPPLFQISDTHFAATWLLHPKAPKIEPPKIVVDRINRMKNRRLNENGKE